MTQVIQGVVKWAGDEKKYGNYSFKLEDVDAWFRNPNRNAEVVQEGNLIKVKATKNKKGAYEVAGVALVQASTGTADGSVSSGSSSGSSRQEHIMLQHSQDVAVATASLIVQAGGVKLSKTKPEASKAIILDLIDELTARAYADACAPAAFIEGRSEVEGEEVEGEVEAEPEGEPDDDVAWE